MQIIEGAKDIQDLSGRFRSDGKSIGFVPTMGALHEGHLSLIGCSREENDVTVVSIFVNPRQFGPGEDFLQYPRESEKDLERLSALGVQTVFIPDEKEMFPDGDDTTVDVGGIGRVLCGVSRPGHFNAVATVVAKLFNIIMPDRAYFGLKDFQQTVVIKKLVKELNFGVSVIVCPTVRENDGLAMSSRNRGLNQEERESSRIIYRALKHGKELVLSKAAEDVPFVIKEIETLLKSEPSLSVEYIEVVDPQDLEAAKMIELRVVICLAVNINGKRLIDNIIVDNE
jgi:pantoate--beta-alanine ligase